MRPGKRRRVRRWKRRLQEHDRTTHTTYGKKRSHRRRGV